MASVVQLSRMGLDQGQEVIGLEDQTVNWRHSILKQLHLSVFIGAVINASLPFLHGSSNRVLGQDEAMLGREKVNGREA